MTQPAYFENVRGAAARRWEQLEQDPELAGPWHQLFKQVQSPRHVLSELLQNADDAGAIDVSVGIENGHFIFTHNGEDFIEEHFASLCRFGYSNKRALHTIGFRGIGFKSTFSLGGTVELFTPTLSVAFDRQRFTEPKWISSSMNSNGRTHIHVAIADESREQAVKNNVEEWLKSPISLLFFKHIRKMTIGNREIHWGSLGPGPVPGTEWMALHDNPEEAFLIARSESKEFPAEALEEIKQERLLGSEQEADFPPCKVEIVLGAKGRLYVVLPTGIETALPFAANAPFIAKPDRDDIQWPSPTNKWLLERVGKLAASVMLQWIANDNASLEERSRAYCLFPDVDRDDLSLDGVCATTVEKAFEEGIASKTFLLTNAGVLKPAKESVIVPEELLEVWPGEQITALLDNRNRPALSRYIAIGDRQKLIHWNTVEQIGKAEVLSVLQSKHLPKPQNWRLLLKLWAYVAPEITGYLCHLNKGALRILPVQGKDALYSATEVVRLGEKKLLQSEKDWEFLSAYLLVINQNWPRFLAEQRRLVEEHHDKLLEKEVEGAFAVLRAVGLDDASDVSEVIERVAAEFFGQKTVKLAGCVQLAQIAAKLGATAGGAFRFISQDLYSRATSSHVLYDQDGTLEALFPEIWCPAHLLHRDYWQSFNSCTSEEWSRWVSSGRAGLLGFVPLTQKRSDVWGRQRVEAELRRRGFTGSAYYPYVTNYFTLEDWDFEETHWRHWEKIAEQDPNVWGNVAERILAQPEGFWSKGKSARAMQVATTGSTRAITHEPLLPTWVLRLKDLPCLPDTRGFYRKPAELLRRTPETEPFMDVEPFIHGLLDRETSHPVLKLLGVRETPTGPERLLDCLRALAQAERPPVQEVEKWYRRLDQMIDTCSTQDFANIKEAFREEKIILTEGGIWTNALGVFLFSEEEDVPGAEIVRASVRDLSLWRKIEVAERPTAELAIRWLQQLPSGKALSPNDARRARALLTRHAARIWSECGHWLNLAGEWVPTGTLGYSLTMQSLVPWSHLHEWVKQKTADMQRLPAEVTETPPFSDLPRLASHIEDRFHQNPMLASHPVRREWLNQLGTDLQRIQLDDENETERVKALASDLSETMWQTTPGLEIIPYIDDLPAGTPRRAEVVWLGKVLYAEDRGLSKLARAVSQELGRAFRRPDIGDAIKLCFDRPTDFVSDYMEENFKLGERKAMVTSAEEETVLTSESNTPDVAAQPPPIQFVPTDGEIAQPGGDFVSPDADESEEHAESDPENVAANDADVENREVPPVRDRHPHKVAKATSIIERFAVSHGFRKDTEDRFFHPNGSWIAKSDGARFWEHRTRSGELIRYYWPKDHCLEREPLQIDADVWGLIDKFPDKYALVLSSLKEEPVEIAGPHLRAMRDDGSLKLYPATYRLVYDDDKQ